MRWDIDSVWFYIINDLLIIRDETIKMVENKYLGNVSIKYYRMLGSERWWDARDKGILKW